MLIYVHQERIIKRFYHALLTCMHAIHVFIVMHSLLFVSHDIVGSVSCANIIMYNTLIIIIHIKTSNDQCSSLS